MNAICKKNKKLKFIVELPLGTASIECLAKSCRNRIMLCPVGYAFSCPFAFIKSKDKESGCYSVTAEMWAKHMKVAEDT